MKKIVLTSLLLLAVLVLSCRKDKAPPAECSETVSYQQDIDTMLQVNCAGCHSTGGQSPNLTTYSSVSANADIILSRISLDSNDPQLMPQGGPKLPDSIITKFNCWVIQGALDN